ncbi:hypothetical protein BJ138DRAFT_1145429 [Hygrophoropsis aurantiaca]|uniref:Uncharacterized protein n=1 Tax=Hygrophoropsis aurantiaca TaxID=72124 RepID=A0ACB8AK28_9AGAM|nr:hypothetical protein BJ138DRAFT_1145429 [Hygrophoropsis aurantiaca]
MSLGKGLLPAAMLALGLLASLQGITAQQTTNVTCLATYDWMNNSRKQNPCLVGAYLQGACNGGTFSVNTIGSESEYIGPTAALANGCQCSTVTYSMLMACSICQNNTNEITWSTWSFNCSTIYTSFPYDIPAGTAVPKWAFSNVLPSDNFNVTQAKSVGDDPEATATRVVSTGGGSPPTSSVPAAHTTSPPSTSTSPTPSGKSTNHAGAIAGGVVGAIVGLAIIGVAITFFIIRRRRSHVAPSAAFSSQFGNTGNAPMFAASPFGASVPLTQPKLYNPSDPSTFPVAPPSPTILTTHSSLNPSSPTRSYSVYRPGHYSGVPEI